MEREFKNVDDIIDGISALTHHPPSEESGELHRIVNIGRNHPVKLLEFIELLEKHLGKEAKKNFLPIQPGDVLATWADSSALKKLTGYAPLTDLDDGIRKFVEWYKSYYRIS